MGGRKAEALPFIVSPSGAAPHPNPPHRKRGEGEDSVAPQGDGESAITPAQRGYAPLLIAALGLALLPSLMNLIGLGTTSATEVVVFAIACMALNILVGYTGLVSFGHGAWFGLAAYAAGLTQRHWFPEQFVLPILLAVVFVALIAVSFGALILRRRGVYFSLLTLALAAMTYSVAFRWTDVTGGENGLGGISRPLFLGIDFEEALALLRAGRLHRHGRDLGALALPSLADRHRAGRDPRERAARPLPRLRHRPLQARRLHHLGGADRPRRHAAAVQQPHDLGRADLRRLFRRVAGDGGDRRHALFPRAGAGRAVLRDFPRLSLQPDAELAVLVRPALRRLHRLLADRPRRRRRAPAATFPQAAGGGRRDGRAPGRSGDAARVHEAG